MQTKEKARHACGGGARLHIDVQFSIDRDRRPHPADTYDVPDYAGRKIEVAPLLRLIREQDAFRPCREPIAETCDLGDGDGDRSWFSDRVRVSLGHVHSTCSGSGLACAVRAGRRHRDATPESSQGLGLLRPAPRSGAWPRPCRRRRRSVSARVQGHGRRAARPLTGATIGCRSISRDPPFGWRRRLPPSPPKPRNGDEAGRAGSNRTSVPGRGHHTTALSWTQCQSFLDNIIASFQPNLSLNDRRSDDRTAASLTAAGRVFLDHARLVLLQVETAGEAARRVAQPQKASFVLGFLTGHEVVWLPETLRILRQESPDIEITLSSQSSPDLAGALMRGKVDVAFLRRESQAPGLAFKFLIKEPLVAVLPTGHRLAARKAIRPQDIAGETYITPTRAAPALKTVIDGYAAKSGITLKPEYDAENLSSAMSLVASTGGVTLLPLYAQNLLSPSVVIRPLQGEVPTIDLVIGYSRSNTSPLLKRFLSRTDELVARVSRQAGMGIYRAQ